MEKKAVLCYNAYVRLNDVATSVTLKIEWSITLPKDQSAYINPGLLDNQIDQHIRIYYPKYSGNEYTFVICFTGSIEQATLIII